MLVFMHELNDVNTITRRQNETATSNNNQALVYITHGMNLFFIVLKNKHKYLYNILLLGFRIPSLLGCPTMSSFSLSLDHRWLIKKFWNMLKRTRLMIVMVILSFYLKNLAGKVKVNPRLNKITCNATKLQFVWNQF